jgi:hypothetical protein
MSFAYQLRGFISFISLFYIFKNHISPIVYLGILFYKLSVIGSKQQFGKNIIG